MSRHRKESVPLSALRPGECRARQSQTVSQSRIADLVLVLESGKSFHDLIEVTEDFVVVSGNHRSEAYHQFFANPDHAEKNSAPSVEVSIRSGVFWDKLTDLEKADLRNEGIAANDHQGVPFTFDDVKALVAEYMACGLADAAITKRLSAFTSAYIAKKACQDILNQRTQIAYSTAREMRKAGYSKTEIMSKTGLTSGQFAKLGDRKSNSGETHSKAKQQIDSAVAGLQRRFRTVQVSFGNQNITQEEFTRYGSLATASAAKFARMAQQINREIAEDLAKTERLRSEYLQRRA